MTTTLVVGWDGATWDLLDPMLERGELPHLQALIEQGVRSSLRSTIPPVTPAAWTEMATGLNAARTGVFGFRDLDLTRRSGYAATVPSSSRLKGRTLFDWAARRGHGVALVGWPMTFPAFEIPGGALVAGWPRPRTARPAVAPESLDRNARLGAWEEGDSRPTRRVPTLAQEIESEAWWDRRHAEIAELFLRTRADRITAVVLSGTDHLAHLLWGDRRLREHFQRADDLLGGLVGALGDGNVLLVSDHGFGPAARYRVHLARALAREGWCRFREVTADPVGDLVGRVRRRLPKGAWKAVRDRLPHDLRRWGFERAGGGDRYVPEATRAFAVELHEAFVGVHVCVAGAMDGGVVPPEDLPDTLESLEGVLRSLTDETGPLIVDVIRREELYQGPHEDEVPHLLVRLRDDCRWGGGVGSGAIVEPVDASERRRLPGSHRRDGVVVMAGPDVAPGAVLAAPTVRDVGMTMLALAGVAVPDDRDGRVWTEALVGPVNAAPAVDTVEADGREPTPQEQAAMEDALRRLGYL